MSALGDLAKVLDDGRRGNLCDWAKRAVHHLGRRQATSESHLLEKETNVINFCSVQ